MKTILYLFAAAAIAVAVWAQQEPVVSSYPSVASLLLANPNVPQGSVAALGLATASDGQGGIFAYSPTSGVSTNSTNVFKPLNYDGRWLRQFGGGGLGFTGDGTIMSNNVQSAYGQGGAIALALIPQTAKTFLGGPVSGSAAAPTFLSAANTKLAMGIQVGTATTANDGTVTNTFATAFASAPIVITVLVNSTGPTNTVVSTTESGFVYTAGSNAKTINWIAIGAP